MNNHSEVLIEVEQVGKSYRSPTGPLTVLEHCDLQVRAGEMVCLGGASGCGKSTLLFLVAAMLRPDSGTVTIAGTTHTSLGQEARARFRAEHLGFIFQQFHLIPYLDVLDNVLSAGLPLSDRPSEKRARELIARLGLEDRIGHRPEALSAGEQQRTAIARALCNQPEVLLADEATGNLDPESTEQVLDQLAEFAASGGCVLMVSHDPRAAERSSRNLLLRHGVLVDRDEAES